MPFGTDNLNYGEGFGGSSEGFGSSIYDEYMGDTIVSTDVEVSDYLYTYDPLKEQNLLADYMSGLTDLGDKTEDVRTKAIAERKALSKSIKGGLTSGTMESMEEEGMAAASRAQAGLYRAQGSAKRGLGEAIGSLREQYESDMASSVEAYNTAVGGDGATVSEVALADSASITDKKEAYMSHFNVGENGTAYHAIKPHAPSGDSAISDAGYSVVTSGDDEGDTWFSTNNGKWYSYDDDPGDWNRESWYDKGPPPASWY
jgi:hypothetical protein